MTLAYTSVFVFICSFPVIDTVSGTYKELNIVLWIVSKEEDTCPALVTV